jgi:hypothetical protein
MRQTLLPLLERIVVDRYAAVFNDPSRPNAYRWIKYEDPDPIGRLHLAVRRLDQEPDAFRKAASQHASVMVALEAARDLGYTSD